MERKQYKRLQIITNIDTCRLAEQHLPSPALDGSIAFTIKTSRVLLYVKL